MKANELRIGNLVDDTEGGFDMIHEIRKEYAVLYRKKDDSYAYVFYKDINPIPLTEEWLVKFGFKFDIGSELYNKSGFDVMTTSNGIDFYLGEYGSWYLNITTVHQLQNLYFALTGEELEIIS